MSTIWRPTDLHASDPATVESLRVGIRPRNYVEFIQAHARGLLARPFVGDLWAVTLVDQPTTTKPAQAGDLDALHLGAAQAFDIGLRNTQAELAKSVADLRRAARQRDNISAFAGNAYMASLMACKDLWPEIAALMDVCLVVTAPGYDILLIAQDDGQASLEELRDTGRQAMRRTQHPLSSTVYRWRAGEWEIALR